MPLKWKIRMFFERRLCFSGGRVCRIGIPSGSAINRSFGKSYRSKYTLAENTCFFRACLGNSVAGQMADGPCACAQMSVPFCPACSSGHRESQRSAPCGTRRSASFAAANALTGFRFQQKSSCKVRSKIFPGASENARPRPWEQTTLAPSGGVLRQITPGAQRRSKP